MATRTPLAAKQASEQSDRQNKYLQVLRLAAEKKQSRGDLESDDWIFRRNNPPPLPTPEE